tara:strand:+ start:445 stop:639 length:195 start_codon:yes stop_codon:yes gene_type:complete
MAVSSKCPKCERTSFELSIENVANAKFKISFIRCSSCGTVVGTNEYYSVGALVKSLAEKLNVEI